MALSCVIHTTLQFIMDIGHALSSMSCDIQDLRKVDTECGIKAKKPDPSPNFHQAMNAEQATT